MSVALVQQVNNPTWSSFTAVTSAALGATPTQNNLLWAFLWLDATGHTITQPSGWTKLAEVDDATTQQMMGVYYKIAGASEATTFTWTWTVNAAQIDVYVAEWSGNSTVTPIDASNAWTDHGANPGSPLVVPSLTTVTDAAAHIIVINNQDKNTVQYTAPSGYTEDQDAKAIGAFSKLYATAGATGTQSVPCAGTWNYHSLSFAIRPGVVTTPSVAPNYRKFPKWRLRR